MLTGIVTVDVDSNYGIDSIYLDSKHNFDNRY